LLYDFDLMMESGHVTGALVDQPADQAAVADSLARLADPAHFNAKYGLEGEAPLLFAMGDGNHSFATAKAIWDRLKEANADEQTVLQHPARHCLVELVNLHDPGLVFEPIHRVLFNVDPDDLLEAAQRAWAEQGAPCRVVPCENGEALDRAASDPRFAGSQVIPFVASGRQGLIAIDQPPRNLVVATLQECLDAYLAAHASVEIDYIHGRDALDDLGRKPGNMGFLLPALDKHALFKTIILDSALPRKAFSMGEADEKRFYVECRRIQA